MQQLSASDRMRLLRFVCSFAWTDLAVTEKERDLVRKLVAAMNASSLEQEQVRQWLEVPPRADAVDPSEIPREHRKLFLDAAKAVVRVDGVNQAELDALTLFEDLLA